MQIYEVLHDLFPSISYSLSSGKDVDIIQNLKQDTQGLHIVISLLPFIYLLHRSFNSSSSCLPILAIPNIWFQSQLRLQT